MEKERREQLVGDIYSERFDDSKEMRAALEDIEADTTWSRGIVASEIRIKPIDNFPLMAEDIAKELGCDKDATLDTMSGTRLAITFNEATYPLRDTAMKSLLERAEVTGGVIRKMSPEELTQLLNLCLPKANGNALILVRGRKVSAVLSGNNGGYEHLPMIELMKLTEDALTRRFGDKAKFVSGETSHSFMAAKYIIEEPALLKEYEALTKDSAYGGPYTPSLAIYSADVGTCSATIAPSIKTARGATIRINGEMAIPHKKGATLEAFSEKLDEVFSKYVEFTTRLGRLAEVTISDPCKAFMLAAAKATLPKKLAKKALEDFTMYVGDEESNAHDIYLGLCEILFYAKCAGYDEKDICRLEDLLARCLSYNWDEWADWE